MLHQCLPSWCSRCKGLSFSRFSICETHQQLMKLRTVLLLLHKLHCCSRGSKQGLQLGSLSSFLLGVIYRKKCSLLFLAVKLPQTLPPGRHSCRLTVNSSQSLYALASTAEASTWCTRTSVQDCSACSSVRATLSVDRVKCQLGPLLWSLFLPCLLLFWILWPLWLGPCGW